MGITGGATGHFLPGGRPNPAAPPTISQSELRGPKEGTRCESILLIGPDADETAVRTFPVRPVPFDSGAAILFGLGEGPGQAERFSVTGG